MKNCFNICSLNCGDQYGTITGYETKSTDLFGKPRMQHTVITV